MFRLPSRPALPKTTAALVLGFAVLAVTSLGAANSARADVTVINQTNDTLFVARGWQVNGKIVYGGWKVIHNGGSEVVYQGNENQIILSVMRQRLVNGQRVWEVPTNAGRLDLEVIGNTFSCEQQGGPLNVWKFTDHATGQEFFKDNNNNWSVPGMFTSQFYIVPGNMNQLFDP
jgi:uncharacterized membrane protein